MKGGGKMELWSRYFHQMLALEISSKYIILTFSNDFHYIDALKIFKIEEHNKLIEGQNFMLWRFRN